MPDDVQVVVTETPPATPETPPSDLHALVRSLVESNQSLVLAVGEMRGEMAVIRERASTAQAVAESAESSASVATDIANSAANIALDTAVVVATEADEETEDEENDDPDAVIVENPDGEIAIVETPAAVVVPETPAEETPEPRVEKKRRYFI